MCLPDNLRLIKPLFGVLGEVAAAPDATPAQVAPAWLLHQPNVLVIPGASKVEQFERNVEAADLELNTEDVGAVSAGRSLPPGRGPHRDPANGDERARGLNPCVRVRARLRCAEDPFRSGSPLTNRLEAAATTPWNHS